MSRTKHHRNQKNVNNGKDLWSRRPNSGSCFNKVNRDITKRKERTEEKRMRHDALRGFDVRGKIPGE